MSDRKHILLTNDDGIDSPGIRRLSDRLAEVADTTVVAPQTNQSWSGLSRTWHHSSMAFTEHELGYAVDGTPTDCVAVGLEMVDRPVDLVVSGCNEGPNLGAHILGRSGTVGAAMEAGFLGVPAIAVSMYDLGSIPTTNSTVDDYELAGETVAQIAAHILDDGDLGPADLLNVNVPANGTDPDVEITTPSREYSIELSEQTAEEVDLRDRYWKEFLDLDVSDPDGTDRSAVVDGNISISPLSVSLTPETGAIPELVEQLSVDAAEN